ncbi:MAG: hypothetical protein HKN67_00105 [Saprospiraceae bacterium]|nr:hypothetical protein [Bacteroidia bacterium]MBT8230867.1 hypothetical protein [Bacteroidia bacterium]NNF20317.1 hypothetical protein [Saprospiraceae bacterium]NNK89272.1 hypothetical protein [Saprospiraceae bacterium]
MKNKNRITVLGFLLIFGLFMTISSCKTAEGCNQQDEYMYKTDKDGNMSSKRGKSNLFSKKQRKKMGS